MGSPPTPRARRALAAVLAASILTIVLAGPTASAAAQPAPPVVYRPPVDGPVVDPFRPPATAFGAGNRGIDYATEAGTPVRSAAGGVVVFAGPVAGDLHVVVLHPDGLRTSYSFLASIAVRRGQTVEAGATVGISGALLHFGVRAGDTYLDPMALFGAGAGPPEVHLVPEHARRPGSVAEERGGLLDGLIGWARDGAGAVAGWGADAARWAAGAAGDAVGAAQRLAMAQVEARLHRLEILVRQVVALNPLVSTIALGRELWAWRRSQEGCTPRDQIPLPSVPGERRILVMVAGFGSEGGSAGILGLDTAALGYDRADIAQFSYRGGRAPGESQMVGVPVNDYDKPDSQGDIVTAGVRLRELLATIAAAHPGIPIDIVAHSQGGLVTRAALGMGPLPADIDHVVTLATPHQGADMATAGDGMRTSLGGRSVLAAGTRLGPFDLLSPAAGQLSEASPFVEGLPGPPAGADAPRFTSIGARGDIVVTAPRTQLDGATNVVVPVDGFDAHNALPGSPEAQREVGLALSDMGPTCRSTLSLLADAAIGHQIAAAEDLAGALLVGATAGGPGG